MWLRQEGNDDASGHPQGPENGTEAKSAAGTGNDAAADRPDGHENDAAAGSAAFKTHGKMKVREYRKGDFPGIMEVWSETGLSRPERGDDEATVERSIAMGGAMFVMCDNSDEEKITGTSWLTFDGRRLHMHHFGITPEHQGKGFAADLLRESLRFVKAKGFQVKLEVHRKNEKALKLYKKAGFEYLGDYDIYIIRNIQSIEL